MPFLSLSSVHLLLRKPWWLDSILDCQLGCQGETPSGRRGSEPDRCWLSLRGCQTEEMYSLRPHDALWWSSMVDWLWWGLGLPTPRTKVGTKDQNLYLEYQLHATFPPRSRQNHSLEPLDIQACLWVLYLLMEELGQHGLGDNEICSSLGKPPVLFLCFLSIRSRDFSGMQITHGDHSVCFVRSYLQAGGLTSSQGEWKSTQTWVKHIMLWILVLLLTMQSRKAISFFPPKKNGDGYFHNV